MWLCKTSALRMLHSFDYLGEDMLRKIMRDEAMGENENSDDNGVGGGDNDDNNENNTELKEHADPPARE